MAHGWDSDEEELTMSGPDDRGKVERAIPVKCWCRGLKKVPPSEIPIVQYMRKQKLAENNRGSTDPLAEVPVLRSSGRGRGTTTKYSYRPGQVATASFGGDSDDENSGEKNYVENFWKNQPPQMSEEAKAFWIENSASKLSYNSDPVIPSSDMLKEVKPKPSSSSSSSEYLSVCNEGEFPPLGSTAQQSNNVKTCYNDQNQSGSFSGSSSESEYFVQESQGKFHPEESQYRPLSVSEKLNLPDNLTALRSNSSSKEDSHSDTETLQMVSSDTDDLVNDFKKLSHAEYSNESNRKNVPKDMVTFALPIPQDATVDGLSSFLNEFGKVFEVQISQDKDGRMAKVLAEPDFNYSMCLEIFQMNSG